MTDNQLYLIGAAVLLIVLFQVVKRLQQVSVNKAKELVSNGAVLVDVRTSGEYSSGHIKKAMNVPLAKISGISKKVSKDKDVIVYCQSGSRSSRAARELKAMGYTKVYNLGGIGRWRD